MNIRDIKTYFAHLLLMGVLCTLTSCQRRPLPAPTPEYHPIELSVSSEWPVLTKAPITGVEDLVGDGFVVWASWAKNSDDEAIYPGDYASGVTNAVFGINGTKVYAGDLVSAPTDTDPDRKDISDWTYYPLRYWHRGTYTFAAVLPESSFNASYGEGGQSENNITRISGGYSPSNGISLTFGEGFSLSSSQSDLMVVFTSEITSNPAVSTPHPVALHFKDHQLTRLIIEAGSIEPQIGIEITQIKIYGNHDNVNQAIFTNDQVLDSDNNPKYDLNGNPEMEINSTWGTYSALTSSQNPYAIISPAVDDDWTLNKLSGDEPSYKNIIPGLIVFPENCNLTIEVTYKESFQGTTSNSVDTKSAVIPNTNWQKGKIYNYKLNISSDRIVVNTIIKPWETISGIDHIFEENSLMKRINIYILILLTFFCQACHIEEYDMNTSMKGDEYIVFTAVPTSYDVSGLLTKGDPSTGTFDEDQIYTAYFLLFDSDGVLRVCGDALTSTGSVSYSIGVEVFNSDYSDKLSKVRVCFVANAPTTFLDNFTIGSSKYATDDDEYLDLSSVDLSLSYCSVSGQSFVVPYIELDIDGDKTVDKAPCLPMYCSSEIENIANYKGSSPNDLKLERLFAKVQMTITSSNNIESLSSLGCSINNIPNKVSIVSPSTATKWAESTNDNDYLLGANSINLSTTNSCTFYVPEHILGITSDNAVQSNKPTLVDNTNKRPIYVSISGMVEDKNDCVYHATYNIFLGGNSTNNFDLRRNCCYINNVQIKDVNVADHRVSITQIGQSGATYRNLALDKSANCYVVDGNGYYMLPAYRGAFNNLQNAELCSAGYPTLVACDNPKIKFEFVDFGQASNIIMFQTTGLTSDINVNSWTNADAWTNTYGNAVISLTTGPDGTGTTLWSWHLWFSPPIKIGSYDVSGISTETYPSNAVMMDRNLGSYIKNIEDLTDLSNSITRGAAIYNGVYYKYGDRRPYFSGYKNVKDANGDIKQEAVVGYHGNGGSASSWATKEKAVTDPCPPGYRVPSSQVWYQEKPTSNVNFGSDYFTYRTIWTSNVDPIYYPYSGYVNTDTNPTVVLREGSSTENKTNDFADYYTSVPRDRYYHRFEKVTYVEAVGVQNGKMWSSDGFEIAYGYSDQTITIDGVHYSDRYWTSRNWTYKGIMSIPDFKEDFPVPYETVRGYMALVNGLENYSKKTEIFTNSKGDVNTNRGYQIRCVSESSTVK